MFTLVCLVCLHAQHTNFNHSISDKFTWRGAVNSLYVSITAWDKATPDKVFTSGHWLQLRGQQFTTWQPVPCHNLTWVGLCLTVHVCRYCKPCGISHHWITSNVQFRQTWGSVQWPDSLKHCSCRERLLQGVGRGLHLKSMILFT